MKAYDHVGTALAEKRQGRGLSLRDVEAETAGLKERDPAMYEVCGRNFVSLLENGGWPVMAAGDPKRIRALLTVLYGNVERFAAMTGVDPQLSPAAPSKLLLPLYIEGEAAPSRARWGTDNGAPVIAAPPLAEADFGVQVNGKHLQPIAFDGQVVYAKFAAKVEPGHLAVLDRSRLLVLAYAVVGEVYAQLGERDSFTLHDDDRVIGEVTMVVPVIPAEFLPGQGGGTRKLNEGAAATLRPRGKRAAGSKQTSKPLAPRL